jgi:hypothetical protein
MLKKISVFLVLNLLVFFFTKAQKIEIGAGLGPTYYKGDLQPGFRIFNPSVGSNIFFRYNATRVISLKANGFFGFIKGDDSKSGNPLNKERDLSFRSRILDYNAQLEYNFLNFRTHNGRYESNWTPYLFGGLGQIKYVRKTLISHTTSINERLGSPDYVLPFGIGFKKIRYGQWNFGVEFGTRVLLNRKNADLFDGFGYDIDNQLQSKYTSTVIVKDLLRYPNTPQKDKYFYINFSISYLFYKVHCPPGR